MLVLCARREEKLSSQEAVATKHKWRKLKQAPLESKKTDSKATTTLAGFLDRGKAQVVDTFMIYTPILYFLTYAVVGSAQGFRQSAWAPFAAVALYGVIVAFAMAWKRQTPGKKAYDLYVIREDGKRLTFIFCLFRFVLFLLSGACVVGILMPLWRKDKRALHDLILKTRVIKKS